MWIYYVLNKAIFIQFFSFFLLSKANFCFLTFTLLTLLWITLFLIYLLDEKFVSAVTDEAYKCFPIFSNS